MECTDIQGAIASGMLEHWACEARTPSQFAVVTTALLPNDDCIELIIEDRGDTVRINDMAQSYTFLSSYGIALYAARYSRYLRYVHQLTERYHADFTDGELSKEVPKEDLWLGVNLLIETIQRTCALVNRMRASKPHNFKEQVYALFAARRSKATMDYPVTGFAQTHNFDLRLNGSSEVLGRAISSEQVFVIQREVERTIYACLDVQKTERDFKPVVIYDDTDPARELAWNEQHFNILRKYEVDYWAFDRHRDQLLTLAQDHLL